MLYTVRLEWLKFKKSSVFQVLTLLYLVLLPLQLAAVKSMNVSIPGLSPQVLVRFPTVWSFLAYSGSWLVYFFFGFFAIYMFSSEFTQRTFRQNIISGMTRSALYWGKIKFILLLACISTLYYTLWVVIFGVTNQDPDSGFTIWDRSSMIPRYFLMNLGYMTLGLFAAILLRRTAMSVFLYFAYTIFMEPILRWLLHRKILDNKSMNFYPANAIEDLTPMPLGDVSLTQDLVNQGDASLYLSGTEAILASSFYILFFIILGYWLIQKRDL